MRQFSLGLVIAFVHCLLLILTGCKGDGAKPKAIPTAEERLSLTAERSQVLRRSSAILRDLVAQPQNAIPDAVLTRSKCVVLIPSSPAHAPLPGVQSCRDGDNSWSEPALVHFAPEQNEARPFDALLVLDLDTSIKRGRDLEVGRMAAAGPVTRENYMARSTDLSRRLLMFTLGNGQLSGGVVSGTLVLDRNATLPKQVNFEQIVKGSRSGDLNKEFSSAVVSFFNSMTPTGIIIHHSGILTSAGKLPKNETEVDHFHELRGFQTICSGELYHVAYHYLILPDGKVQAGRPERCQGAHAPGYNSYLGISLVGDFSSVDNPSGAKGAIKPSREQMLALYSLTRRLTRQYNIPVQRVLRHSDVTRTLCPGDRFPFASVLQHLVVN